MANMFQNCSSLTEIPLLNTANVTVMTNTFTSCTNLRYIPALNLSNLTSAASLFNGCTALREIPPLNLTRLITGTSLFNNCISLPKVGQINIIRHADYSSMFNGCSSLIEVGPLFFTGSSTAVYTNIFTSCPTLRRIQMFNVANNITIPQGLVSANELNEIYTNLATVGAPGSNAKTITVTNNWGTPNDDPTIATNKGWQITG
jgi:surface protein